MKNHSNECTGSGLGLALSPLATAAEIQLPRQSDCAADAKPGPDASKSDAIGGENHVEGPLAITVNTPRMPA